MIKKYTKKPVEIVAVKWEGSRDSWNAILDMGLKLWNPGEIGSNSFYIETLEGRMKVSLGDYVIKGIKGEFYSCKPDIFLGSYKESI
jgi:hypothetical protein